MSVQRWRGFIRSPTSRQAIEEELQRSGPPADPGIERARALLEDFGSGRA